MRTIRRAVVIGNGIAGAENQCLGLVRALGLFHSLYPVTRPSGGINNGLRWLPVSLHKRLDNFISGIRGTGFLGIVETEARYIAKLERETFDNVLDSSLTARIYQCGMLGIFLKWIGFTATSVDPVHPRMPLLIVNIGGPTGHCRYGEDLAKQLTATLLNVLSTCGSLRIYFSCSTPKQVSDILVSELGSYPKVYLWNGEDPNPHMGHLAWGDAFVITADSVSMLSEACIQGSLFM